MKATNAIFKHGDGILISEEIFKDPKTNTGGFTKKSAKGYLKVIKTDDDYKLVDQINVVDIYKEDNVMQTVYKNGEFLNLTTFTEIKQRVNEYI